MGNLWNLWQEYAIDQQMQQSDSLEQRVSNIEETLTATITLLKEVIRNIEVERGEDIDGDGNIG